MVERSGYFSKLCIIIDEGVCNALYEYANTLHTTPDHVIEQLVDERIK
jgi:hypothetical protein